MNVIVLEPVKISGRVAKPGEVIDTDGMSDDFIEGLLIASLVAVYDDSVTAAPTAKTKPIAHAKGAKKATA
ncbi:hypothetical protein [Castellaniella caeni]|uniref:hypothetical protein n=1 Tax=Castellaniella caeni TaxID=266123 RepID=UPI0011AF8E98|nr:hypothetical protein [Castellaniella caeni]